MTSLNEENKELQTKLAGALRELDKLTGQLAQAQEIGTELKNKLEEKKHSEQLAGWAIDRAIETIKLYSPSTIVTSEGVIAIAAGYTDWVMKSSVPGAQI